MSKQLLYLGLLAMAAIVMPAQANLVTNGSFDANSSVPTGWTQYISTPASQNVKISGPGNTDTYSYDGTYALRLYSWVNWPQVEAYQSFPISGGTSGSLSFVWSTQYNAAWGTADCTLEYYNASGVKIGAGDYWTIFHTTGANPNNAGEWKTFSQSFTPVAGTASAVLHIRAYQYVTAYFDNVVVTPEPATIGVLGLGGLALLRRKSS